MQTLKTILAVIACTPIWLLLIWLMEAAMDYLTNLIDTIDDRGLFLLIKPVGMFIFSTIVPVFIITIGLLVWIIAEQLFRLT